MLTCYTSIVSIRLRHAKTATRTYSSCVIPFLLRIPDVWGPGRMCAKVIVLGRLPPVPVIGGARAEDGCVALDEGRVRVQAA